VGTYYGPGTNRLDFVTEVDLGFNTRSFFFTFQTWGDTIFRRRAPCGLIFITEVLSQRRIKFKNLMFYK